MRPSLPMLLLAVLLSLLSSNLYAAKGCVDTYGSGKCVPAAGVALPPNAAYLDWQGARLVDLGDGLFVCQFYNSNGDSAGQFTSCDICQFPNVEINGQCVPPTGCAAPKESDGAGGCKCPAGYFEQNEACVKKPDCSDKTAECSASCGGSNGSMSGVAYFYCEVSIASDPSTQLFHTPSYNCECAQQGACPQGKVQVYAVDGTSSCGDSKNPGCPQGSYYGDFNGQTGCIAPSEHNDPDETPKNCISGTNAVYHGSTLYCVPPPDSPPSSGCPTGTTATMAGSLKICSRIDANGNSTGDSPDTNGYIKGSPTSGSGTGTGDGTGSGTGTGTSTGAYDAAMAARLSEIKANTDAIKASSAFTSANTQAIANNTDAINKALTGTMQSTTKGSFTDSIAQLQSETDQIKTGLSAKIDQIRNEMTQKFSASTVTGVGSLPCFDQINFLGQNIQFCFTQFNDDLSIIGQFIFGLGFLLAAFIILRKD